MLIINNCSCCGVQIEPNEREHRNVAVSVDAVASGEYFHADLLCDRCYNRLIDSIRKIAKEDA